MRGGWAKCSGRRGDVAPSQRATAASSSSADAEVLLGAIVASRRPLIRPSGAPSPRRDGEKGVRGEALCPRPTAYCLLPPFWASLRSMREHVDVVVVGGA